MTHIDWSPCALLLTTLAACSSSGEPPSVDDWAEDMAGRVRNVVVAEVEDEDRRNGALAAIDLLLHNDRAYARDLAALRRRRQELNVDYDSDFEDFEEWGASVAKARRNYRVVAGERLDFLKDVLERDEWKLVWDVMEQEIQRLEGWVQ